ncbi:LMAN1 (predicted), partial [Pycnogonum litorale]
SICLFRSGMATFMNCLVRLNFVLFFISFVNCNLVHRRYEYKYCFKGPYLAQHDGSIPFWEHGGHAQASDDTIRITSSLKSQKGRVWSKLSTTFQWWQAEITFRISSSGRVGADGLAFWFTEQKGTEGAIFGSNDKWKGLGIFFDSFDNDADGNNPYISATVNDGTISYNHEADGKGQILSGCHRDFRNKPYPVKAKIEYYNNILTVMFHSGQTEEDNYELCFRVENIHLPNQGHFGLSAATGGLADDHDVLKFLTYSLSDAMQPTISTIPEDARVKYSKEYEDFNVQLEQRKQEYKKQHPEKVKKVLEEKYETVDDRERRQINEGQNAIFRLVRELNHKCDEIIGRQERTMSLVQAVQVGGGTGTAPGGGNINVGAGISRHEVDTLVSNQREMVALIRDVKSFVIEVNKKTSSQGSLQQPTGGAGGGGFDNQLIMHEVRDGIKGLQQDVASLSSRTQANPCPTVTGINCISPGYFILFIVVQCGLFVGYIVY